MIAAPKCLKCNALAKHDPVGGVMTTYNQHSATNAERMRQLNADPEFAAANAERAAERMRKFNADPDHNPLVMLTTQERADYDTLKAAGYNRDDAFRAIGRADLIRPESAE